MFDDIGEKLRPKALPHNIKAFFKLFLCFPWILANLSLSLSAVTQPHPILCLLLPLWLAFALASL